MNARSREKRRGGERQKASATPVDDVPKCGRISIPCLSHSVPHFPSSSAPHDHHRHDDGSDGIRAKRKMMLREARKRSRQD